jgi:hypothetical protein
LLKGPHYLEERIPDLSFYERQHEQTKMQTTMVPSLLSNSYFEFYLFLFELHCIYI